MRALAKIENALLAQRGQLFCWVPVCLGIGIGGYFSLRFEPDTLMLASLLFPLCLLLVASRLVPTGFAPLLIAVCLIGAGAGAAKWRTEAVAGPSLGFRYYGGIEGRIVNIDRSASDALRLTLDSVQLERMSPQKTPNRVRISIHTEGTPPAFEAGDVVMTTGHLSPPSGPAEPGGFDFQRHAWFLEIGGVGYTRNPVLRLHAAEDDGIAVWLVAQRIALASAVRAQITGEAGGFAAAIMTGDRSGISAETMNNLRATNLAHLLAISGLHMGLLTGFVFAVLRFGMSLVPWIALRFPTKKIAAFIALITGAGYLALSGGNVATERAFIMVGVMFVAVMLDRRAFTLRAVAMAATLILLKRPEALIGPGFQMSFAATTALVFVFGQMRKLNTLHLPKWVRAIMSVVISSAVAGFATAPFAAVHFNQFAHYGLIANLLSVPLMGVVVMPAAVLAICLMPLGMWGVGLWIMEQGLLWILFVAGRVAKIEGGLGHIVSPQSGVLPLMAFGLIWFVLWQGRARSAGLVLALLAAGLWMQTTRSTILVADSGGLIGIMGDDGRALSKAKGDSFVAGIWLENDGNPVTQDAAAQRAGAGAFERKVQVSLGGWSIVQVTGKTALAALDDCSGADILIASTPDAETRSCEVFDTKRLRETGALAIDLAENGDLIVKTAQDVSGSRPWNGQVADAPSSLVLARPNP